MEARGELRHHSPEAANFFFKKVSPGIWESD